MRIGALGLPLDSLSTGQFFSSSAWRMATDPFDDLLELENDYYKEGYDAGVADSTYAGMIEANWNGIRR